jgi:hypothetical protein
MINRSAPYVSSDAKAEYLARAFCDGVRPAAAHQRETFAWELFCILSSFNVVEMDSSGCKLPSLEASGHRRSRRPHPPPAPWT